MDCINEAINEIDKALSEQIRIDNKMPYGVVTRQKLPNGDIVNLATNLHDVNDGILSTFDDAFDICWFHRVNTINVAQNNEGAYGRTRFAMRETINVTLCFYSKSKYHYLGQYQEQTQLQLYRRISQILPHYTQAVIKNTDLDMPSILAKEFTEYQVSKETLLLTVNYELTYTVPIPCICPPINDCPVK